MGAGMGKPEPVTVGFRYFVGMHMVLAHGPLDNISEIRVGDRTAWTGNATGGQININARNLFGGDDREGGISGAVDVEMGGPAQGKNSYLLARLGDVPAFRGVAALVLRRPYLGTIPRFKPWAVTARRTPAGWPGAGSGLIGQDANPVHIIYELITHPVYGMGYSANRVDTDSLASAASRLSSESFGLSFEWRADGQDVGDFMMEVLRHLDGSAYVDPATGLWRLALARDDYNPANLDVLDETNVVRVVDFSRPSLGELVNEVTVIYIDGEGNPPSWEERAITVQNLALLRDQGNQVINQTIRYDGVTKASLANDLAARDLRQLSTPLARLQLTCTAEVSDLRPGDVRKFSWPEYGIVEMIVRIVEVQHGTIGNGRITVHAVEDVFAQVESEFAAPTPTEWIEPLNQPAPAPQRKLIEATYYHVARRLGESETLLAEIDDLAGFLRTAAVRPSDDAFNYEVHVDAGGGFQQDGSLGDFSPSAVITESMTAEPQQVIVDIDVTEGIDLDLAEPGTLAYLDDEIVHVADIDLDGETVTLDRGVIDTVPQPHSSGARLFFAQNFESMGSTEFALNESVDVRLLPSTALGRLALSNAPTDQITFSARFIRPYPPGRVRVNGEDWPDEVAGVPTLSWAHRDRTLQTGPIIKQLDGPVGPEPGITYTVRVRNGQNNVLRRTVTGIDTNEYVYTQAEEEADGDALGWITFEIDSVRDGHVSWQQQRRENVKLIGYGRHYGENYGGLNGS